MDTLDYGTVESGCRRPDSAMPDEASQLIPGRDQDLRAEVPALRLLACFQHDTIEDIRAYADYLCYLLQGDISFLEVPANGVVKWIRKEAGDCDLIVFGEPKQSLIKRFLIGHPCHKVVNQMPLSIMIPRRPSWPIQTILLIVRIEETDEAAVDWVGRLARLSGARVSILPISSSYHSLYAPISSEETALGELLSPYTQPGQLLRYLSHRIAQWQIDGTLRFRQGEPEWQIRWEVMDGNYDLIVIGGEPYGRCQPWLMSELVVPMLSWLNRPLLIARPLPADQSTTGDCLND